MKLTKISVIALSAFALLTFSTAAYAQNTVEQSKEVLQKQEEVKAAQSRHNDVKKAN